MQKDLRKPRAANAEADTGGIGVTIGPRLSVRAYFCPFSFLVLIQYEKDSSLSS